MALSARPVSAPSGPNVSSAHMPAGGRNVASAAFSAIEELGGSAEVLADPNFNFQGFTEWTQERQPGQQRPPRNPSSNFDTNSTTFLHLLGQHQRDIDPNTPGAVTEGPTFHAVLSKAILAYESTAEVIGNAPQHLGASISVSL